MGVSKYSPSFIIPEANFVVYGVVVSELFLACLLVSGKQSSSPLTITILNDAKFLSDLLLEFDVEDKERLSSTFLNLFYHSRQRLSLRAGLPCPVLLEFKLKN